MQIPHCVHPEISQEGIVRCSSPTTGGSAQAVGNATRDPAPCKGIFLPEVELWEDVAPGQSLGQIVDSAGRTLAPVASRRKGHVILVRHSLSVDENEGLVAVVEGLQKN